MRGDDELMAAAKANALSTKSGKDPDELLTLLQAARELGLNKKTLAGYVRDEVDPLPSMKDEYGIYHVRRGDVHDYLATHPARGRSWKAEPDRQPVEGGEPGKTYLTLSEAAKAAGCSTSAVRSMTRKTPNPLPTTKNKDGYVLVEEETFWEYYDMLHSSPAQAAGPRAGASPETEEFGGFPELEGLTGTYQQPKAIADALGLPPELVRSWTRGPGAVEHMQVGRRVFINKHKLPAFLERKESRLGGYAHAFRR